MRRFLKIVMEDAFHKWRPPRKDFCQTGDIFLCLIFITLHSWAFNAVVDDFMNIWEMINLLVKPWLNQSDPILSRVEQAELRHTSNCWQFSAWALSNFWAFFNFREWKWKLKQFGHVTHREWLPSTLVFVSSSLKESKMLTGVTLINTNALWTQ